MTTEASLGAARLDIEVDVTQLEAAIRTAKSRLADMSTDAQRQYQQLSGAEKRRIDSLLTQADTLGLTKAQQLAYNAALKTSGPVLDEITSKIALNEAKLRAGTAQFNAYGLSAKQTAAAMRQVPAQLTDIVVGLSSGQRPLMVLLQQGGQLKDVFGGIVPAARALGGAVMGLVNPYTVAAAAVGSLAVAYYKGQQESYGLQKAIILSGNAAGVTSGQLAAMARGVDDFAGTQHNAASVLGQLVSTGRVAGSELENVAKAVVQLNRAAGVSIEESVKQFAALGEKPAEASRKLNEQYHYLNASALERIKLLEEEGRVAEAAALAQSQFADAGLERAKALEEHLGALPKLAREAKEGLAELWDGLLNVGRESTPEERIAELERMIRQAREALAKPGWLDDINGANDKRRSNIARMSAERFDLVTDKMKADREAKEAADRIAAETALGKARDQWDKILLANLSKEERLERTIAEIRKVGAAAKKDEAEIEKEVLAARQHAAGTPKVNADDNAAKSMLETVRRQIEANNELALTGKSLSASETLGARVRQALADKTNTMTAATRLLLQSMLPVLEASDESAKKFQAEAKAKEALVRQNSILEQQTRNRRQSNTDALMGLGRGQEYREQAQRRLAINREYEAELRRIGDKSVAEDKAVWDKLADNARKQRDEMLREEEEFQRRRQANLADPMNGARAALEDYLANAQNVSEQTYGLLTNSLEGAEDAFVKLATTGKLSFRELANSILADIARIAAKQAILAALGIFGGGASGISRSIGFTPTGGTMVAAKGAAFEGGAVQAFAAGGAFTNKIVDQPTLFPFAKGTGLMGEAGPEAIMPLKRTQGGQLGVVATGAGGDLQVQINNYAAAKVAARQETFKGPDGMQMRRLILDVVADDVASGGPVSAGIRSRFNVQERV